MLIEILVRFVWMESCVHWSTSYRVPGTQSIETKIRLYHIFVTDYCFFSGQQSNHASSSELPLFHSVHSTSYSLNSSHFLAYTLFIVLNCTVAMQQLNGSPTNPGIMEEKEERTEWGMTLPSGCFFLTQSNRFIILPTINLHFIIFYRSWKTFEKWFNTIDSFRFGLCFGM